jgi:hypothetical protein
MVGVCGTAIAAPPDHGSSPQPQAQSKPAQSQDFQLNQAGDDEAASGNANGTSGSYNTAQSTTMSTEDSFQLNYDLAGPYEMRSADPETYKDMEIKNIIGWSTSKDGTDDDYEYEFEIEWGVAPNHELIFEVPVELGDGRMDGNGDAEFGWHWRLWEEQDMLPAFAMRNFIRVPTGVDSSGVDWKWIGLFTKSIVPGKLRFDVNPFVQTVNGNNEEEARHFRWGAIVGLDWRVREDLVLIGSYHYENGELEGTRDNHMLEFGGEWEFAKHHELGFSTQIGLDGDGEGPDFGAKISYIYEF